VIHINVIIVRYIYTYLVTHVLCTKNAKLRCNIYGRPNGRPLCACWHRFSNT